MSYFNLWFGIPYEHQDNDGVVTVCGNPFQRTATQLMNGTLTLVNLSDNCLRCLRSKCLSDGACRVPLMYLPSKLYWDAGGASCDACGVWVTELGGHGTRKPVCAGITKAWLWNWMSREWDSTYDIWRESLTIRWWVAEKKCISCRCDRSFVSVKAGLIGHQWSFARDRSWSGIWF